MNRKVIIAVVICAVIAVSILLIVIVTRSGAGEVPLAEQNATAVDDRIVPPEVRRDISDFEICGPVPIGHRIIGGEPTAPEDYPWTALIFPVFNGNQSRCGGSLITSKHVLTAAHCIPLRGKKVDYNNLNQVILGEYSIQNDTDCFDGECIENQDLEAEIAKIDVHPNYFVDERSDIAIITLKEDVKFTDFIKPVCLSNKIHIAGTATAVGWGNTENNTKEFSGSDVKKGVSLPIVPNDECAKTYPNLVRKNTICAGGESHKDTCVGDSGGPLQICDLQASIVEDVRCYLVGIVWTGHHICGKEGAPGIYTNVIDYYDWIVKTINS